jgi:transposase
MDAFYSLLHKFFGALEQRDYDKYLYKLRHLVENCFLVLKRWRGIATRYAKTSDAFIAAVHVRCIAIWAAIRT